MQTLLSIQHWLYGGMSEGLGAVAGGDPRAVFWASAAAILFGAVHALMPGHGKTVLVSYHLGQKARPVEGFVNGAILAITHVGLAVAIVLAGFAVISRAFAYGGRTPQFEFASGILIVLIGGFLLWRSLKGRHHTEPASDRRHRRGRARRCPRQDTVHGASRPHRALETSDRRGPRNRRRARRARTGPRDARPGVTYAIPC